jgi:hypothetical protein
MDEENMSRSNERLWFPFDDSNSNLGSACNSWNLISKVFLDLKIEIETQLWFTVSHNITLKLIYVLT